MEKMLSKIRRLIFKTTLFWSTPSVKSKWKAMENTMRCLMVFQMLICLSGQISVPAATGAAAEAQALVTGLVNVMLSIFKYVGMALITWGVIQFLLAIKKSDAESKSEAVTTAVVGIALYCLNILIGNMGIDGLGTLSNSILDGGSSTSTPTPEAAKPV